MNIDLDKIKTHLLGKSTFVATMVKESVLTDLLNEEMGSALGRKPEIPYGTLIEMMIVNLCDDHKPLTGLSNYYNEHLDLEGIFKFPVDREKLTDDRFGLALDHLYDANPKRIFAKLAAKLFEKYDIKITKINFDTTSKVMWGSYETPEGEESKIDITYGHSKDKRRDKKQVKMAIGSANGVIVDIDVLSGNVSDKIKQQEALEKSCLFILSTSDLEMSGEEILQEYKTQDSVEKNFQLLKSPKFVNSLYLESMKRIEAFMYLMMIIVMIKSVVQYVVRRELKKENDYILGNENKKNYKPTFTVIYSVFHSLQTMTIDQDDGLIRRITTPLSECVKK